MVHKIGIQRILYLILIASALFLLTNCTEPGVPKPMGFLRTDLPETSVFKKHETSECPFVLEYSDLAKIVLSNSSNPCWFNIHYPDFNASIHLSYKPVNGNLQSYLEDSRTLAYKHTVKAFEINETLVLRDTARVFGLKYDLSGNAASNVQFYLTDSTDHFIRGALYFNSSSNYDSIKPVLNFIKNDIDHLISTVHWLK